ncbi:MAG TPA: nuclear transport factor 2 family protein [Actinomycetota bacterium]|nr:nuclear transport factor 2 family protein [Actinomycetota bacterium]
MGSKNVETLKGLIEAFNKRKDLDAIAKAYDEQAVLVDHARSETMKGRAAVKENWGMWATAFPDGKIEDVRFIDGGETVAMVFVGHGKNDGKLGPLPSTGKTITLPYCSVFAFNSKARIVEEDDYWDQLGFMVQLGHMPAPAR